MDPLSSPRLGRRARYDSFTLPLHFPDPNYSPHRRPHFAPLAPHTAARTPPAIPQDHYHEPQQAFVLPFGDLSYFPSPHRSNPPGLDPHLLHSPMLSDRATYLGPPRGKPLLSELWERGRYGGGAVDKTRVFDEGSDRFKPYANFFKLGDPDTALIARRRLESEQDRFLGEDSEWKDQRQLWFWDERESRRHDPFLEQLPPEAAPLATSPPPFSSPRGLRSAVSANNRGGEASRAFVHRPPPRSPLSSGRSFSDPNVVKSTAAMVANSQVIGNGPGPQSVQSICKKKNYVRDAPPDRGFGGSQYLGRKAIKKSYPINVATEVDFWSSYHMVRKTPSIPSMDNEHEFEEDCSTGNNGKRKMVSYRNAKYYAHLAKQPKQKPSAFSRIQSGLSVWERLEEKPLILSPPCSPPCSLSSPPRISNENEAKADILDLSFKSNSLAAKVNDPLSTEPIFIEKDLFVEKPNKVMKKKNMVHTREKVVIPIVSSSPGSFANQGVQRNSNVSSFKSVSVLPEANKEVSSCMPGNKSISHARRKKAKKLAVAKNSGAKEAAKMVSQEESCIIETARMEDGKEAPKYEGGIKCVTETNNSTHNGYIGTEPIDDNHLQICQKGQMMQETSTNDASANIITKDVNQTRDIVIEILDDSSANIITKDVNQAHNIVIEILDDSGADIITKDVNQARDIVIEILDDSAEEGPLELGKKLDSICRSPLFSDVNDSSQLYEYIIPFNMPPVDNFLAQDSSVNMDENDAANSRKQIKQELKSFVNSPREIGQEMLRPNNAASPELLGAGEVFVSAGSRTPYSDNSLNCNGAEIKIDREVKNHEKMVFSTATKEVEVPGTYVSSQSCLQGLQVPSFSEVSNAAPKQKSSSEGTVKENDAHSGNEDHEHWGKDESFLSSMVSLAFEPGHESCKTNKNHRLMSEKAQLVPSHELKKQAPPNPKLTDKELSCKKTLPHSEVPRFLSNRPNFSGSLTETARTGQTGRHRTWLRTNTPLHSDENPKLGGTSSKQVPKRVGKAQNSSYFRKGNSLIRKLAAELPPVLLPTVGASSRKFEVITESSTVRENRSECPDNATPSYPLFERPRTPPLPALSKLTDCTMNSCKDFQLIPVDRSPEPDTDQGNQCNSQSKALLSGNLESQDTASCKAVETVNVKRVTYVKHKMNQLVAAPGPEIDNSYKFRTERFQIPVQHRMGRSKTVPFSSSYLYYRSKRNQLIRNASTSDSHPTEIPAGNTNSVDSLQQGNTLPLKKRLDNVLHKTKKPTRSSLVWTLGDKLSQKGIAKFGCQRVFPYIFPWKRAVNWKSFMITNNIPISSRSSLSLISQKLQCLRKRDTIYKVSNNGFSLRKARVVSIGGSSLKWSKSIEKRSKKASEEATLAVAEVERKERERKISKSTCGNGKNKVGLTSRSTYGIGLKPGERIFRVGSARYKMDSSKRSLLRIPDDHSSSPASQQLGNSSQISFVPRRLVIGNNEYVRIGNGNQLVRDPKKLKRILANEKVRWSLHTARLRLAQKRQYCLFFTRFGKCNKSGGKCPFIHDPTKVAICTKFLKGQCSDINCKLTHKVIPERMQDCSYFLKGLCTNINCPYRHVKVNANAPLCDGFLRGHCADGDECRKKHSYTCPLFEATGKCPQGSLCKLHHPKSPSKSRKRKRTKIQSSSQGRYFYSSIDKAGEPLRVAFSQNDLEGGNDIFFSDGRFTEYINLDVDSDGVGIKNNVLMESYPGKLESDYFDMQSCDMDALVKPVRIMNMDDLAIF